MKIDLKKDLKSLYQPTHRDFVEVVVPPTHYLAVDGHGDPNTSPEYLSAVESLYTLAYAARFALKFRTSLEWVVGPLEGLWSSDDPTSFSRRIKQDWEWTMLIPLPEQVSPDDLVAAREKARSRMTGQALEQVQVLELNEGRCLQILHIGSYDDEAPTLARLHDEVMPARGLTWNGRHHEIYLSDPRRSAPEKLRTVLRQPVTPVVPG